MSTHHTHRPLARTFRRLRVQRSIWSDVEREQMERLARLNMRALRGQASHAELSEQARLRVALKGRLPGDL